MLLKSSAAYYPGSTVTANRWHRTCYIHTTEERLNGLGNKDNSLSQKKKNKPNPKHTSLGNHLTFFSLGFRNYKKL